jgi:cytochrome c oxidase cbb3-type subunit IV
MNSLEAYATLAFFLVFGGIVLWAYWPGNRKKLEEDARIPLDDDRPLKDKDHAD